jgi:hypothetical protein
MDLPFLLAGPIVRRVEPRSVSVWVATSEACTVRLRVWPGPLTAAAGSETDVFLRDSIVGSSAVAGGDRPTLRVGTKLHIAVVTATTTPNAPPLLPGKRYSYNVGFRPAALPTRDLRTEHLLEDRPPQPPLGYDPGVLPSFVTCPTAIEDLVVLHGSCNRTHALGGPNLLYAIDELVEKQIRIDDELHRPHQLWLTGDQVYADEVPRTLSSRLTALGRDLLGADEVIRTPADGSDPAREIKLSQANFPAGYRAKLMHEVARLTAQECDSHLLGLTERLAMQLLLWSPAVWERDATGKVLLDDPATLLVAKTPPSTGATDPGAKAWLSTHLTTLGADEFPDLKSTRRDAVDEVPQVLKYAERAGYIRRGLANVATYMVFDDHDVTDDWNICQLWVDRVLGNPVGRSVVRDGLLSFALTQGWGNNPTAFDSGPGADLLARIAELFPAGAANGPNTTATGAIDTLLGLSGQPPKMRWHYRIDGPAHRVIACDTRTRRGFTGPVSPPQQLPDGERETQIPEGPLEAGIEMLMVVLAQPAMDPVLLGELTQGLISRGASAKASISKKLRASSPDAAERSKSMALSGLEMLDYEGWGARPAETTRLLDRLASYPRVMILSGDVHFAVTLRMRFWRRGQGLVSTIGQFTSSAFQYITFPEVLVPLRGQGWVNSLLRQGYPAQLLIWRDPVDDPVSSPHLPKRALRRRMLQRPVMLPWPEGGWPTGSAVAIAPDFSWSIELLDDQRTELERPVAVQHEQLVRDFDATDPLGENGYAALARRHQSAVRKHANTRTLGLYNKFARLSFRRDGGRLVARSELMSIDHFQATTAPAEPFTQHEVFYDAPVNTPDPATAPL